MILLIVIAVVALLAIFLFAGDYVSVLSNETNDNMAHDALRLKTLNNKIKD